MGNAEVVEYRMLAANNQFAVVSLFASGLRNTTLLQLARMATGLGQAFSVYAVYREGQMTFEASARLEVLRPSQSLESILHDLVEDADFLHSLLAPMTLQVERHFAPQRR